MDKAKRSEILDSIQGLVDRRPAYAYLQINHFVGEHPPLARALAIRADCLIGFRQGKRALADLRSAERLCGRPHAFLHQLRGDVYACRGNWAVAQRYYADGQLLGGDLHESLVAAQLMQGKFGEAQALLQKQWAKRDQETAYYTAYQLGLLYRNQEDNRRSACWLRKALALEPNFPRGSQVLEDVQTALKILSRPASQEYELPDQAGPATSLAAGRRWRPQHAYSMMLRACELGRFGRLKEAQSLLPELRRRLRAEAPLVEGQVYKNAERYTLAAKRFQQGAATSPFLWVSAGGVLARLGKFEEAEHCHRQALIHNQHDPDVQSEAWLNLALLQRAQLNFNSAVDCAQEALKLDPDYKEAQELVHDLTLALDFYYRHY